MAATKEKCIERITDEEKTGKNFSLIFFFFL